MIEMLVKRISKDLTEELWWIKSRKSYVVVIRDRVRLRRHLFTFSEAQEIMKKSKQSILEDVDMLEVLEREMDEKPGRGSDIETVVGRNDSSGSDNIQR